jgi:threonine dehydratase
MNLPSLNSLEGAALLVYDVMPPTPQICWPGLSWRLGAEVWVKHENHTPIGAFKIRGGLVYFDELKRTEPNISGVVAATRGNHGQSIAFSARRCGIDAVVVVPHGNSFEKNAAMRARGAELIEHGSDFQEAFEHAEELARTRNLHLVPSFCEALMRGVASYSLELLRSVPTIETLYVPVGLGSGVCGAIAARDALGSKTAIVAVTAEAAPAYTKSLMERRPVQAPVAPTIADGMACRVPNAQALEIMMRGVERVVSVSEDEIRSAMRELFTETHNVAEGAGAAAWAAAVKERSRIQGQRIAIVQTGGNVDRSVFVEALARND